MRAGKFIKTKLATFLPRESWCRPNNSSKADRQEKSSLTKRGATPKLFSFEFIQQMWWKNRLEKQRWNDLFSLWIPVMHIFPWNTHWRYHVQCLLDYFSIWIHDLFQSCFVLLLTFEICWKFFKSKKLQNTFKKHFMKSSHLSLCPSWPIWHKPLCILWAGPVSFAKE